MLIDEQLYTPEQACKQLEIARLEIIELRDMIAKLYNQFKKDKELEKKVSANIDELYYQLVFLRSVDEKFINIVVKNNKIVRIEAKAEEC